MLALALALLPCVPCVLAHGTHDESKDENTLGLRIAAVFIILAAGLIGGLPPLYIQLFRDAANPVARMLRAAAGGIVLALGLVHIFPRAVEAGEALAEGAGLNPEFNIGGCCTLFGVFLMMVLEGVAHGYAGSMVSGEAADSGDSLSAHSHGAKVAPSPDAKDPEGGEEQPQHGICIHPHKHPNAYSGALAIGTQRQKITAYSFELGCVVHSVLIGVALGVIDNDFAAVRNFTIALAFHQVLEGVGLGAFISAADFSLLKGLLMVAAYSVTAPLGIGIGIGVSSSYEPNSIAASASQSVLEGVSAGILLYMGLIQMVAIEFAPESLALVRGRWWRVGVYAAFFVAAACMAFLEIWA